MTFLKRLKAATHALHRSLEDALPLGRPGLTREDYGLVLQSFSAVIPALETRLLALNLPADFGVESGLRAERLRRDLTALGLTAAAPLHDWNDLSGPEALGALYVLEGSRLGGALIARGLPALGLTPEHGGAYFEVEPDLGARWKTFQAALEQHVSPDDEPAVMAGAGRTFAALLRAWQEVQPAAMVQR